MIEVHVKEVHVKEVHVKEVQMMADHVTEDRVRSLDVTHFLESKTMVLMQNLLSSLQKCHFWL